MHKVYIAALGSAAFGLAALGTMLPEPASARNNWPCREFLFSTTCHWGSTQPQKPTKPWTTGVVFSTSANGANRTTGHGGPANGEYAANIPGMNKRGKSAGEALDITAGPSASGPRFTPALLGSYTKTR